MRRRITPDAHLPHESIDGRLGGGINAMAESFAPATDAFISIDTHQQRVDAGAGCAAGFGNDLSGDDHRCIDDDGLNFGNLHRVTPCYR